MTEAAKLLGISRERVRQLVVAGRIPVALRHGRVTLIDRATIQAMLPYTKSAGGRPRKAAE